MQGVEIKTRRIPPVLCGKFCAFPITSKYNGTKHTGWELTEGALPEGISFDADKGLISGIPTTAGEYTFTLTLKAKGKDGTDYTVSKEYKIIVYSPVLKGVGGSGGSGGTVSDDQVATNGEADEMFDDIFGPGGSSGGNTSGDSGGNTGGDSGGDDPFDDIFG